MRRSLLMVVVVLMGGCAQDPQTVAKGDDRSDAAASLPAGGVAEKAPGAALPVRRYPAWVEREYRDSVVSCVRVRGGDLLKAKKVAIAKAQAEIAFRRQATIEATVEVERRVEQGAAGVNSSSALQERISQSTRGAVSGASLLQSELVDHGDMEEYCIRYGADTGQAG